MGEMIRKLSILVSAAFAISFWSLAADAGVERQATSADEEPRYDPATVVDAFVTVVRVQNVARKEQEAFLTVKSGSQTVDIYLCPAQFLMEFKATFNVGDRIGIVGSKIKFRGTNLILAREVRKQEQTLYLRDAKGVPNWR